MKTKFYLQPSVLSVAVAAAVAVAGSPAYAVEAKISGQVNRALMQADDGPNSELLFVDNDNSSTRFRFTGSEDIGGGLKAGIVWEVEFQSDPSDGVTPATNGPATGAQNSLGGPDLDERKMEVYLSGGFGQVTLGQGDGAMNGGIETDLSGTSVVSYAGTADIGRAILFQSTAGAGPSLGSVISQQDFESRYDRLRYDSPSLGPIKLRASIGKKGNSDTTEFGLVFNSALAGGKIAGAFGMSSRDVGGVAGDFETTGGSISWASATGLNLTFALSSTEDSNPANPDADFTYFKVGYKTGPHAVSFDLATGDDQTALNDEAEHTGIQYVYTASKAVELYAGYKTVSLDRAGSNFDDITILLAGSRVKF